MNKALESLETTLADLEHVQEGLASRLREAASALETVQMRIKQNDHSRAQVEAAIELVSTN
jgi:hypothetical protein